MFTIDRPPFYKLAYDKHLNRVYFNMRGFWKSPEVVPHYLQDWFRALKQTEEGFSLLVDVSQMVTHPTALRQLHEKAIELSVIAGVSDIAEITPHDRIALLQTSSMAGKAKVRFSSFAHKAEAEAWLNHQAAAPAARP